MTELQEFYVAFMDGQIASIKREGILTNREIVEVESRIQSIREMSPEEFEGFRERVNEIHSELDMINVLEVDDFILVDAKRLTANTD